ncbi:MAG: 4-hydroxy-tetrahydrodipicolinate reductase [Candidatus Omnitrophica bacterium]|nr:4-hydroxy-tetrahydrodipicolinate reductase [Candidatus Omnitrophota bacterium]
MIKLAVAGAAGRMGGRILTLATADPDFIITGALEHAEHPHLGQDIGQCLGLKPLGVRIEADDEKVFSKADVVIDFSHHSTLQDHLRQAVKKKKRYVVGTTGLDDQHLKAIRAASRSIAVVQSPNMSVGVNLLFKLAELAAKTLDEGYDLEISETHHRMKKDAPSGTAVKLLEVLADARKKNIAKDTVYGRVGEVGARPRGQIGVLAMRGGDVVGDHTVFYFGDGERLELTHRASSRDAFAQGALRAAKFIVGRKSGLYDMQQVLGISGLK